MSESRGMSLIEILVVLGMGSMLAAIGAVASLSDLRRTAPAQDRDLFVDALMLARARAQSGRCTDGDCGAASSHGVHIADEAFVVFEGASFEQRHVRSDFMLPRSGGTQTTGPEDILFTGRSGDASEEYAVAFGVAPTYHVQVGRNGSITSQIREP